MPSDLVIIGIYLVLMFIAGLFFSKNIKSTADYFQIAVFVCYRVIISLMHKCL